MDYEREKKIYEVKIANLEATLKSQAAEIQNLKSQLAKASEQIKDIAVSVVSAGSSSSREPESLIKKN